MIKACLIFMVVIVVDSGWAQGSVSCDQLLSTQYSNQQALAFLRDLDSQYQARTLTRLANHGRFVEAMAASGLEWDQLSEAEKWAVVSQYLERELAILAGTQSTMLRDQTLLAELEHRGLDGGQFKSGYEALRSLSSENKKILMRAIPDEPDWDRLPLTVAAEIKNLVADLDLHFVHNTAGETHGGPVAPVLSSKVLGELGVGFTANSRPFNTEALRSDNNVFFFAVPYLKNRGAPYIRSAYGQTNWVLNRDYAFEYGWISPFVMQVNDLFRLAAAREEIGNPLFVDRLKDYDSSASEVESFLDLVVWPESQFDSSELFSKYELWHPLVSRLSQLDFRPQDILEVLRKEFRHQLVKLYLTNEKEYRADVEHLRVSHHGLNQLIMEPLGFTSGIELKVPLSVPANQIRVTVDKDAITPKRPRNKAFNGSWGYDYF